MEINGGMYTIIANLSLQRKFSDGYFFFSVCKKRFLILRKKVTMNVMSSILSIGKESIPEQEKYICVCYWKKL